MQHFSFHFEKGLENIYIGDNESSSTNHETKINTTLKLYE